MEEKKLACFFITGEMLLEMIKDRTNLPEDTKLIKVKDKKSMGVPIKDLELKNSLAFKAKYPMLEGEVNNLLFIVTSDEFWQISDDEMIPIIIPESKR